jgi:hypothetical protein
VAFCCAGAERRVSSERTISSGQNNTTACELIRSRSLNFRCEWNSAFESERGFVQGQYSTREIVLRRMGDEVGILLRPYTLGDWARFLFWAGLHLNPHPLKPEGAAPESRLVAGRWSIRLRLNPAIWGTIAATGWR